MSIAQHSVAGEGEARPQQSVPAEVSNDAAALAAFRCDSINLPWVIFRAAFRANQIEQLPARARSVLAALARTVDANRPFAAIFARRELLTGRAMQSMRTFYRSLDDLEAAELIERRPQSRYVEVGRFGRANLHLTERAVVLLGLVEVQAEQLPTAPAETAQTPSHAVRMQTAEPSVSSFIRPTANVADGAIYGDLYPASSQKRQPGQLPADLQRLRSLGFIDFLIFKLMKEARENRKRLSDVVEATWEHLKAAKRPINYLRALLRSPVDFAHQLRSKAEARHAAQRQVERAANAELIAQRCAGQTFIDTDGQRKYVLDTDGQSMTVYVRGEGVGRQAAGWKEQFAEALEKGRIRRAALDNLEAFGPAPTQTARASAGEGHTANVKPPVTAQVRSHIAGLRAILRTQRSIM
jgi:hypothetical protein